MQPLDVLYDPKASKDTLRRALAAALGVPVPDTTTPTSSLFNACREVFIEAYNNHTGLSYRFGSRDGMALQSIIGQLRVLMADKGDESVLGGFRALIANLPDWYRQNQFNLPVIDKKFNDIVSSIKSTKNGNSSHISADYKRRVLGDLLA